MPEYDLVIRGGTVVDGTGIPRYKADVAVKSGRVAKISGKISAGAAKEVDASGCIVAPGAVDLHTHYDGQINWDPYASLSGWFGVTSLTIGQCGFGFAPTRPEDRDLNMRMMNRIEAIPLESMRKGMRWDWETFPEYLDSLDRQGLGVNIGALFPFQPARAYVLGMMPARERTSVTEPELNQLKQLFDEAMKVGAFGFSLNMNFEDRPEDGGFLPSQVASEEEFLALAEVMGQYGVGHIGQTIGFGLSAEQRREHREILTRMMRISGCKLHMLDSERTDRDGLDWIERCRAEGLPLAMQRICTISGAQFKLSEYNSFDYMPNWIQPLVGTPEERSAKLRDPAVRAVMKRDVVEWPNVRTNWDTTMVAQVVYERNYPYEGKSIVEIAQMMGKDPVDAFLDLALDEGLETEFSRDGDYGQESVQMIGEQIKQPYAHVSVSDGGAHTRFSILSTWPVFWLSYWIRDREILSLEEGIRKMSAFPAWLADFKDRGTLRVGSWADIIVYNQAELGFAEDKPVYANDFPGGERRLIQKPTGLRNILVNGTVTFEENECSGALPGKLLRSYDMVG